MPTSSMAMPIGMRSAISSSSTPMPIRPIASLRDIVRAPSPLGGLRSIRKHWMNSTTAYIAEPNATMNWNG